MDQNSSQKYSETSIIDILSKGFIKLLRFGEKSFIYDVNLNIFYEVSKSIAFLFGDTNSPNITQNERIEAESLIFHLYDKLNAISPVRPQSCHFLHSQGCFQHSIRHRLNQLTLNITDQCNLQCKYCIYSGLNPIARRNRPKSMTQGTILRAIEFYLSRCDEINTPILGLYGGEPTLKPRLLRYAIEKFISARKGKPYHISITTNGVKLTPEMWEYFHDKNISLLVSVDGPPEIHDRYRAFPNGGGSFEKVARNLEWGLKNYPEYYRRNVSFSITLVPPYKFKERSKFFTEWKLSQSENHAIGYVNGIDLNKVCSPEEYRSSIDEEKIEYSNYVNSLVAGECGTWLQKQLFQQDFLKIHRRNSSPDAYTSISPNICMPSVRRLFVDIDGKFHVCEKILPTCSIGDVRNGLNEKKLYNMATEFAKSLEKECCDCWAARFCTLCFLHAVDEDFEPKNRRKYCENVRNRVERAMSSYCYILSENGRAFDHFMDLMYPNN